MTRTITISDEHYEEALRTLLQAVKDEFDETILPELDRLLDPGEGPLAVPQSRDVHNHLMAVRRTLDAIEALGWPPDRAAASEDVPPAKREET